MPHRSHANVMFPSELDAPMFHHYAAATADFLTQ